MTQTVTLGVILLKKLDFSGTQTPMTSNTTVMLLMCQGGWMSLGTCTSHWGAELLQQQWFGVQKWLVTNDSGGPGGPLVGLWGSAPRWTT